MKATKQFFSLLLITGLFIFGCEKSTDPQSDSTVLYEDAAESIAAAMGDESGGATENFADVMIAGGGGSLGTMTPIMDGVDLVTAGVPIYDSVSGWWTVSVNRSQQNNLVKRSITREYRYRFLKNGIGQKNYIAGNDTATTLRFWIVSGTGFFQNSRVSHSLTQLKGAWTSNNINKDTVTITLDSNYVRSGTDTITTRNMQRTHKSTLTLTSVNVKAPRYRPLLSTTWRSNFYNAISGTISGNYTAEITFQRGDLYKERSINRDFTVTVGSGNGTLLMNGNNGSFKIDMQYGYRK
ncbi:MAG: hypothetical protein WDA22_13480 [Bacteroidota bacterium]